MSSRLLLPLLNSQIKNDTKYQFTVKGSRVRALSWYPNLYGVEEINE